MEKTVNYTDNYQKNYQYKLMQKSGENFQHDFTPELTPKEMLGLGIFGGAYFTGVPGLVPSDLPKLWFRGAKLSKDGKKHKELNFFGINASQDRSEWLKKNWISTHDPHGWFQWYCRYFLGRRLHREDGRQIKRWKAIDRHSAQIKKNCRAKDLTCRKRQRQMLLHWAYDSRNV